MEDGKGEEERIRKATAKDKAIAGKKFIDYWENKLKCSLQNLKPGPRPKRQR